MFMGDRKQLKKATQDTVVMLVLMAVALLFYFILIPQQVATGPPAGNINFTSRTFPNMMMGALFVLSLIGFVRSLLQMLKLRKTVPPVPAEEKTRKTYREIMQILIPYITYALILIYCLLFIRLGFIISTLIMPPIMMFVLGCRKWHYYLIVYAFAGLMYFIFSVVMNVPLP